MKSRKYVCYCYDSYVAPETREKFEFTSVHRANSADNIRDAKNFAKRCLGFTPCQVCTELKK